VPRPLIGISASLRQTSHGEVFIQAYTKNAQAIERAGGLPLLISPETSPEARAELIRRLDGLLLPGGEDINPARYGADAHPKTGTAVDARDHSEIALVHAALDADLPLFCICRGHQVLNVALGGTLVQDIPDLIDTELVHWVRDPRTERPHRVQVDPQSKLAGILGATDVSVNSIHHQAIYTVAPGLITTAHAPDGIIEGLEVPGRRFALSVQWHPEDLTDDPMMQGLFDAFVAATL
jgi:putative glutamine amidotransferase